MSFSVSKRGGQLQYKDYGGFALRNPSTIWCIQKADEIYKWGDFSQFVIHTGDYELNPEHYTYSKRHSYNKVVPDFNFHGWPEVGIDDYDATIAEIDAAGLQPYTLNKVGWIGNTRTHRNRTLMVNIGNQHPKICDFSDMNWINSNTTKLNSTKYMSLPDLVRIYSLLVDIEGNGYSGRLKYLLWSHRPVLLVERPHKEYFFKYLVPWAHYIPVKNDLSDLIEKTNWCLENYQEALAIAERAYQFSKLHLTRDACYARWNELITEHIATSPKVSLPEPPQYSRSAQTSLATPSVPSLPQRPVHPPQSVPLQSKPMNRALLLRSTAYRIPQPSIRRQLQPLPAPAPAQAPPPPAPLDDHPPRAHIHTDYPPIQSQSSVVSPPPDAPSQPPTPPHPE